MTPGTFVRITSGPYSGMTGELLLAASGSAVVRLTATGEEHVFDADEITFEQRDSDQEREERT